MNTNDKYTFSGHESFPCKTLWLKKGYDFSKEEKDKLADDLIYLFRECEKYADISKNTVADNDVAYSFDMV